MQRSFFITAFIAFAASLLVLVGAYTDALSTEGTKIAQSILSLSTIVLILIMIKGMPRNNATNKSWMVDPDWLPDAMFVSDLNGNIDGANKSCQVITGVKPPYKTVNDIFELVHSQLADRTQADDVVSAVMSSPQIQFSDTLKLQDGRTIERTTKPIKGTDMRLWILCDVTQVIEANDDHVMHNTMLEADAARTAEMAEQLYHAKAELEAKQAELTRLANTDSLTGLYNRRRFSALAQNTLQNVKDNDAIWAIMMDIDHFKRVNDTYGHSAGDVAIRDFAKIITEAVGKNGFIGRMGGEEFAAILPGCSTDDAFRIAEKIRKETAKNQTVSDAEKFRFTTSVGLARWIKGETNIEATLDRADQALYSAKSYGRNRVVGYE